MTGKEMTKKNTFLINRVLLIAILFVVNLSLITLSLAGDERLESDLILDIKLLKDSGKIISLEKILDKLSMFNIHRLLEVEFKQNSAEQNKHPFVYEIEYINDEGYVLEIEVDALTAQVLSLEQGD